MNFLEKVMEEYDTNKKAFFIHHETETSAHSSIDGES